MDTMRQRGGASWFVAYTLYIVMVGPNLPSPLYELYRERWHLSSETITLLFATYPLVLLPSLLLVGPLSDRLGRRAVIVPGVVLAVAGSSCFVLAPALAWLFLARALQGMAVGSAIGALTATVVELWPQQNQLSPTVLASLAVAAGGASGPLLAGILAHYAPEPTRAPYLVYLVLLLPAVLGAWYMPETVTKPQEGWKRRKLSLLPSAAYGLALAMGSATAFIAWAVIAIFVALAPTYVAVLLQVHDPTVLGSTVFLLLGASATTQALFRHLPIRRALVTGISLLFLGLSSVIVAVPLHSLALLLAGTMVTGIGHGLAWMASLTVVTVSAPSRQRGEILAQFYVAMYLGVALPVIGVGFVTEWLGLYGAFLVFAGVVGMMGVSLAMFMSKVSHRIMVW